MTTIGHHQQECDGTGRSRPQIPGVSITRAGPGAARAGLVCCVAMVPAELGGMAMELGRQLVEAVGMGLPCTIMAHGDVIYRSTLLQSDGLTITALGVAFALATVSYIWATPGVAPGFFDMFVHAFAERLFSPAFGKDDFVLGKKLGEGVKDWPQAVLYVYPGVDYFLHPK